METRANYVLIGAFALAGFLGLLVFLLIFARIELDRRFDYYEARFTSVSGLSRASEVRFSGLPVGQVVDVRLAPERDGSVLVRLEVQGGVPVRTDSEATIEMMGVTGVSYVGISAGSPTAPLLTVDFGIPEIAAGRSVLQTLTEDAPEILAETLNLLDQLTRLFDATNQQKVQNILDNLERSSEELSQALVDFAGVSQTVGQATADIAYFTTILEPVIEGAEATLARVDTALETYTALGTRAVAVLEDGDEVLAAGRRAFDAADLLLSGELPELMRELSAASTAARGQVERLGPQAEALIAEFSQTGTLANERLAELAGTIAATDTALAGLGDVLDTVERAAAGVEGLVSAETTQATLGRIDTTLDTYTVLGQRAMTVLDRGEAALGSGQRALDAVERIAEDELPALMRELTATSAAARAQLDRLGGQAEALMAGFTQTGTLANDRLAELAGTIAATDTALAEFGNVLGTVERAAGSIEELVTAETTQATLGRIDGTLDTYSALGQRAMSVLSQGEATLDAGRRTLIALEHSATEDLPELLRDLAETSQSLRRQVDGIGAQAGALMAEFQQTGALASARLRQAETTLRATDAMIADLTQTLDAVERAAENFDTLMMGEGSTLIAETRAMIADANEAVAIISQAAQDDLPAIVADIRGATDTASRVIGDVGRNLTDASDRFDDIAAVAETALTEVTATFARANVTLESVDRALITGERTLQVAERAFAGAERVLDEEIGTLTADLRTALGRLDGAIAQVSDDIPAVSASLRAAAASAEEAFADLGRVIAATGDPVRSFTTQGLPQFTQLARETRTLITNLDRLTRQIERNPTRFFLGSQTPEFRR
jgi:phospholipid/cholesterol/gamma-HCH transport system substrate-binding protein